MARKKKPAELPANPAVLNVASMKFWSRFQNPPPMLAFPFAEPFETVDDALETLRKLQQISADETVGYSLRISLDGSKPPVWRRILVQSINLETLHHVIQFAMGWQDSHLHEFEVCEVPVPLVEDGAAVDERSISIGQLYTANIKKFEYTYDFGDDWKHTILIEKTVDAKGLGNSPECVGGRGICPVEDIGGMWNWKRLLEAVNHPEQERHGEIQFLLDRIGSDFASEMFDRDVINVRLKRAFNRRGQRRNHA